LFESIGNLKAIMSALKQLPIGTRIRFLRTLVSGPDEFGPGNLYAKKGDGGVVTGHNCPEGHWVKWDGWPHAFGAELEKEFIAADVQTAEESK
jgi:hypothetical protein